MIVDDHPDVRFLIRAIIDDADEDVEVVGEADGVQTALEVIDGVDPDVVVLDAVMPLVGGFEAAPMILARRPAQRILLCSALVDDEIRAKALAAGIAECVSKDEMAVIPGIAAALARG
jgi:two-component system LytT family response regulator